MQTIHPTTQVSVITIFKNASDLIEQTMLSVLRQTYPDIEYVLVGSSPYDETVPVVREVLSRYGDRTASLHFEATPGISHAMNRGVECATGEIVIHLHAGDRFLAPDVIARVMETRQNDPWRWATAGSLVVDAQGRSKHIYRASPDYQVLNKKNMIPHQSTFLARDIFLKHGLFRTDLKQAMDYEFWLRIAFAGGERYRVLPFETTAFLEGGRSSKVRELLRYLWRIRRETRPYRTGSYASADALFLGRVFAFWLYSRIKSPLRAS